MELHVYQSEATFAALLASSTLPIKPRALALITSTSPVAWRHLLLGGHYIFDDGGKKIDLDALLD
jgi:hypothetical protein